MDSRTCCWWRTCIEPVRRNCRWFRSSTPDRTVSLPPAPRHGPIRSRCRCCEFWASSLAACRWPSLDLLDGTPILDIKPYVPEFDARADASSGWYADAARKGECVVADDRFSADPG